MVRNVKRSQMRTTIKKENFRKMKSRKLVLFFILTSLMAGCVIGAFVVEKLDTSMSDLQRRSSTDDQKTETTENREFSEAVFNNTMNGTVIESSDDESKSKPQYPIIMNTWPFFEAGKTAWETVLRGGSCLDAVEDGCSKCEELQCDRTVGYGGSPDENGETALDAMIMDGQTYNVGSVGGLRYIKNASSVARHVLERTSHSLLVGSHATEFAEMMGFKRENLSTTESVASFTNWKRKECQPNFWVNVQPDPTRHCGPYEPIDVLQNQNETKNSDDSFDSHHHDTIGLIAIDKYGNIAAGTSSNGASHKIPGRVGDSPIPGSGAYADAEVGGAAATGDGDVMMRFLPSFVAVEKMREGHSPQIASTMAIQRISKYYKSFSGAVIAVSMKGEYGAACYNLGRPFTFTVGTLNGGVRKESIDCVDSIKLQPQIVKDPQNETLQT